MPLADELTSHRDRILADLNSAHDYCRNTRYAWRRVDHYVGRGAKVNIRNTTTGNATTEKDLPGKVQLYLTEYLTVSTLQQFVSLYEDFLLGLMRHWLLAYPRNFGKKQLPVSIVFEARDLHQVKLVAIDRELYELGDKKLKDWVIYLEGLVKAGCPREEEIDRLAEIKATRDVFVHNRGGGSAAYEEKAGARKRFTTGEKMDVPEDHHRESGEVIKKVVADVSAAAIAKA